MENAKQPSPSVFFFSPIGMLRTAAENNKQGGENIWANMIALRTLHATSLLLKGLGGGFLFVTNSPPGTGWSTPQGGGGG